MKKKTYLIPSIHCQHCIHTISMELGEIEGVQKVVGNIDTKQVEVVFSEPATDQNIVAVLKEINYTPKE